MVVKPPYILFIGDAKDQLSIKLAKGVADWKPELAIGELAMPGCSVSTGLNSVSLAQGIEAGAKTLVLGFTNSGGIIDARWIPTIVEAIEKGLDIASGLHQRLDSINEIATAAKKYGRQLIDVRHPTTSFKTGQGQRRIGQRLLTVGTDCSVGKMYTALAIEKAMKANNRKVSFKATGQCGIFIAGDGIAVDCVISDFISGAVEALSPDSALDHWDIIEGQGSLFHPAFAGVSLGLLHGAQPDALVVCHAENRQHMRGISTHSLPTIQETIETNLQHARLTNPDVKCVGLSINTSMLSEKEADAVCHKYQEQFFIPCVDPIRHGVESIIKQLK